MKKLRIINLSKNYGNNIALSNFDLTIKSGEIVGLIGRNGAGKTTLLNCIAGNIFPDNGQIVCDNQNILHNSELRMKFGVLIEPCFLEYMNCYDNLKLLMIASGVSDKAIIEAKISQVLEIVGLNTRKKDYVKKFSFGMKQRMGFAQTLLEEREMLFLDEPFVGLDINGRQIMKNYLRKLAYEKGVGILFSDHNLDEVNDLCHRVVAIQNGIKIYDGLVMDDIEYEIEIGEVKIELINVMSKLANIKLNKEEKKVILSKSDELNNVLRIIMKYTTIENVRTKENALEKLLKEGK